jgi:hypothetical protein
MRTLFAFPIKLAFGSRFDESKTEEHSNSIKQRQVVPFQQQFLNRTMETGVTK